MENEKQLVIRLQGKRDDVLNLLRLMVQHHPNMTLKEIILSPESVRLQGVN